MTYEKMTAQELHDLVERLEAHGFRLPDGLDRFPRNGDGMWLVSDRREYDTIHSSVPFAAAIIEVAARDWWLGSDPNIEDGEGYRDLHISLAGVNAHGCHIGDLCDELAVTPLHAIVAAVEAKDSK